MRLVAPLFSSLLLVGCDGTAQKPFGHLDTSIVRESSGLSPSGADPDFFWTHNDSGDTPRIFAVNQHDPSQSRTITISGARHVDWEALERWAPDRLIIGDFGNNHSLRDDLRLYIIKEPDPRTATTARVERTIAFRYEDQTSKLGKRNYDCEAMIVRNGIIYLLTKHRSDTESTLYRVDPEAGLARVVGSRELGDKVTDAAIDPKERYVAVLTYSDIWLFDLKGVGENLFLAKTARVAIDMGQNEGVMFDGDRLVISNEEGELFAVPLKDFIF